ncbi:MAG: outer membrane beta-barrel protein [Rhodocyclaceae bacterium]|nr:outer membrane beta-barrel protein [Rhodocyclaceae bacterium]
MYKHFLAAAGIAALSVAAAQAGDFYVLGAAGRSTLDLDKSRIDAELVNAGAANLSSSGDKHDTGYKLQLGYQFSPYLAVEGGYIDLGRADYTARFTGGNLDAHVKAQGWNIEAVGIWPINDQFNLFAKLGAIVARVKVDGNVSGGGITLQAADKVTRTRPTWGIGAGYAFNKNLALRLEYEWFDKLGDTERTTQFDARLISLGLAYKF